MYAIETKDYGLRLSFQGAISVQEMSQWAAEVKKEFKKQKPGFNVIVDVSKMGTIIPECIPIVVEVQNMAKENGTGRNANIVGSHIAKMQQTRMAKESGLYSYMRYIDASSVKNPEQIAQDWVIQGKDPDI